MPEQDTGTEDAGLEPQSETHREPPAGLSGNSLRFWIEHASLITDLRMARLLLSQSVLQEQLITSASEAGQSDAIQSLLQNCRSVLEKSDKLLEFDSKVFRESTNRFIATHRWRHNNRRRESYADSLSSKAFVASLTVAMCATIISTYKLYDNWYQCEILRKPTADLPPTSGSSRLPEQCSADLQQWFNNQQFPVEDDHIEEARHLVADVCGSHSGVMVPNDRRRPQADWRLDQECLSHFMAALGLDGLNTAGPISDDAGGAAAISPHEPQEHN